MKTFAGEGELLTSVGRVEVLSLLKTEELAPLNRLKGASDAAETAEITEKILLLLEGNTVSTDCYSDLS